MACCIEYITTFKDAQFTTVVIPAEIVGVSKAMPMVQVMYQYDGDVEVGGMFTSVKLQTIAGQPCVVIDHGGQYSGWVKLK